MVHKYNNIFLGPWAVNSLWLCLRSKRSGDCGYAWITAMVAQVSEMSQIKSPTRVSHEQSPDLFPSIPEITLPANPSCAISSRDTSCYRYGDFTRWANTEKLTEAKPQITKGLIRCICPQSMLTFCTRDNWDITFKSAMTTQWRHVTYVWKKGQTHFQDRWTVWPFARQDRCTAFMHH